MDGRKVFGQEPSESASPTEDDRVTAFNRSTGTPDPDPSMTTVHAFAATSPDGPFEPFEYELGDLGPDEVDIDVLGALGLAAVHGEQVRPRAKRGRRLRAQRQHALRRYCLPLCDAQQC